MARADLSAMLGRLEDEPVHVSPPSNESTTDGATTREVPSARQVPRADTTPKPATADGQTNSGPLYSRLDRKETRLRPDQYERLTEHARRLNRAKGPGGERITENTLIRVAIDMLLERTDDLAGKTESELRNSVTL